MYEISMDLKSDWAKTALEVLRGAGSAIDDNAGFQETALNYFLLTMPQEQAEAMTDETGRRLEEMENIVISHMQDTIVPDIRERTRYTGNTFHFCWVYNQGEHIVELNSEYRIPL
ncbi:hypothetical protein ACX93W_19410 [Paenibacillus sp. CAU 1782]